MGKEKDKLPEILQGREIQELQAPPGTELLEDFCALEYRPEDLHEGEGDKQPYLKGRLGWVDRATANKRLYKRSIMVREIARLAEEMKTRGVYGELDHPGDGKTKMTRVSHFVLSAEITEEGEILGRLEFIPGTTNGDQALAIARKGGKLGVSSRGFGSIAPDNQGNHVVQEDYKLVTWDIVGDPANAGAHPNFVVEEKETTGMDLNKIRKDDPELYEEIKAEGKAEAVEEAREHAREALREDFQEQLRAESETLREEAVEKARGELLNDPTVAGAATAVEKIKEVITPFVLDEDESKELTKLRQKLAEAHAIIAERDEKIQEMDEENEELAESAKEFGLLLHLERELAENGRREQIEAILGDVNEYADLDELSARLEEIAESLAEEDARQEEFEERISELEANNVKLSEERDQALGIGQKFGLRAYVERKIADHPHRNKLRNFLNESTPASPVDVDRLVETFTAANPVSDEFTRIRNDLSGPGGKEPRGRERNNINESVGPEKDVSTVGGVSMTELARRADGMR